MSCPFCGSDKLDIDASTYWTGMRSQILSYTGRHFCGTEGFDKRTITIRGKTEEDVQRLWDERK